MPGLGGCEARMDLPLRLWGASAAAPAFDDRRKFRCLGAGHSAGQDVAVILTDRGPANITYTYTRCLLSRLCSLPADNPAPLGLQTCINMKLFSSDSLCSRTPLSCYCFFLCKPPKHFSRGKCGTVRRSPPVPGYIA